MFVERILHNCVNFPLKAFSRNSTRSRRRRYFRPLLPYKFPPEIGNDVISSKSVDNVCRDVSVKFGDSMSNGFRGIREADFVSDEHNEAYPNSDRRFA